MPRKVVKKRAPRRKVVIEDFEGAGWWDSIKAAVTGAKRMDYPPEARGIIAKFGDRQIYGLRISRAPVQSMVTRFLNGISFGQFGALQRKYGYDKFFHLSLIADVPIGAANEPGRFGQAIVKPLVLEKNEVLRVSQSVKHEPDAEILPIQVPQGLTLRQLLDNARRLQGDERFFRYDAFQANCQDFVMSILKANGLNTPALERFVKQDISELTRDLNPVTKAVAKNLTDLGHTVDVVIHGQGLPDDLDLAIHAAIDHVLGGGLPKIRRHKQKRR